MPAKRKHDVVETPVESGQRIKTYSSPVRFCSNFKTDLIILRLLLEAPS
jgi:hypothetical protein